MSDSLKKVQSGDPLVIPAQTYNAFIDAAVYFRQRTTTLGQGTQPGTPPAGIILIRNDSGSDRQRFDVLGISAPIITPATNLREFSNRVAMACVTPATSHEGKFVVLAEPIPAGKIGRAYASGVCPVQVNFAGSDASITQVDISAGQAGYLKPSPTGPATILWREGGTGSQWAIIRLGTAGLRKLDDLADVTLTSPATGDLLRYDAGDQQWKKLTPTTLTVITDYRINGLTLQKKTRTITIIAAEAESAWTTVHTGTTCP